MSTFVIDTNLLVLFVVGGTSESYISRHKRLTAFSDEDYDLLLGILTDANGIILTPNTLTEASSLLRQSSDPMKTEIYNKFKDIIENAREQYISSRDGSEQKEFVRLGLTDAILLTLDDQTITLVTTDFGLYHEALSRGNKVINFNHYRETYLGY